MQIERLGFFEHTNIYQQGRVTLGTGIFGCVKGIHSKYVHDRPMDFIRFLGIVVKLCNVAKVHRQTAYPLEFSSSTKLFVLTSETKE